MQHAAPTSPDVSVSQGITWWLGLQLFREKGINLAPYQLLQEECSVDLPKNLLGLLKRRASFEFCLKGGAG